MIKRLIDRVIASKSVSSVQGETMTLGGVEVTVRPLTPAEAQRILSRLETIPSIAMSLTANKSGNVAEWLTAALQVAWDEMFDVIAEASGLSREHLTEKAYLTTEIIPYLVKLFEVNRLPDDIAKKLGAALKGIVKSA